MKVYLDLCAIQRPLDSYNQVRIVLEAEAVLGILALCDAGRLELASSEALQYETEQNLWPVRREHAKAVLAKAKSTAVVSESAQQRAGQIAASGIKPLDALHLALAEASRAEYFCTCDDELLRKGERIQDLKVRIVSPLDLVQEIEG